MIRAYLNHDPADPDARACAFRLARLELAEHLASEDGVPNGRMTGAGGDGEAGGVYLVLEAEGLEGRRAFSRLLLELDGHGASQSLFFEYETAEERHHLDSLPLCGALIGPAGSLIPPLRPVRTAGGKDGPP